MPEKKMSAGLRRNSCAILRKASSLTSRLTPTSAIAGPISLARKMDVCMVAPLCHVAFERNEAPKPEQNDARADEKSTVGNDCAGDKAGKLRCNDPERADAGEEPPNGRYRAAPVGCPRIVDIEDVEPGDQRQNSGKIDEGKA